MSMRKIEKQIIIFFTLIVVFSSCTSVLMSFYGVKQPKTISDFEILNFAEKEIKTTENIYKIDSSFMEYINSFSNIIDTNYLISSENTCIVKNEIQHDLYQPIQAMYFDNKGNIISYFTNCYAGGFPNLKWNKHDNFVTFPPKSLANIHNEILFNEILLQFKKTNNNYTENDIDYTIVIFWNKFMKRQSLRLIKLIQKNTIDQNVKIIYVNNDNFFLI